MTLNAANAPEQKSFGQVIELIRKSRHKAFTAVNKELINLYWEIGKYINKKTELAGWGKGTVEKLAKYIQTEFDGIRGFSSENLWRMKKFYETYSPFPKLSPLVKELSWTNNLHILSKTKTYEEKEFYINLSLKEKYSKRELERQIDSGLFERVLLSNKKLSPMVTESEKNSEKKINEVFKDTYVFEFLDLPERYIEKDLRKVLVQNLKKFILEMGRDFTFVGEEFRLQVGNKD